MRHARLLFAAATLAFAAACSGASPTLPFPDAGATSPAVNQGTIGSGNAFSMHADS